MTISASFSGLTNTTGLTAPGISGLTIAASAGGGGGGGGGGADALLMESGSYILMETGSKILLE